MYLKGRPITMFMPKEQVDGYCLEAKGEPPSSKLKLDWVYPSINISININFSQGFKAFSNCEPNLLVSV